MTTWNYIKGSEKDFQGAPDWASILCEGTNCNVWYENDDYSGRWSNREGGGRGFDGLGGFPIIAQRKRVTSVNDDRLAHKLRPHSIRHPDGTVQFGCIQTTINADMVNHPSHYTQGGIECIDAITAATVGKTGIEAVCVANVVKYLWRYEEKNGLEDVKKARWYLERLISELENK